MRRAPLVALAAVAALLAAAPAADAQRPRGDVRVLAKVPPPGFPAHAYVHPNGRTYVGTYTNPTGDTQRSRVLEYGQEGSLYGSWTVPDQNLAAEHGVQVATSDGRGRLVLLDRTPARALLLNRTTGEFDRYSTFTDLPVCAAGQTTGCSPSQQDLPPMANYGAWGPDGSLYVTDFQQAVLWRVPPGGGAAQIWLADRRLDGRQFGTTGIALAADRRTLLVAQGSSGGGGDGNPATGKLYSLAIQPNGTPGDLRRIWESGPAELADGFGIAASGRIYIALANGNAIAVLAPDGRELQRFESNLFDTPSSARFLGTRLMVANQSFTGNRENQAILDVEAGETGLPEFIPAAPDEEAPELEDVSLARKRFRVPRRGRAARVRRGTRIRFHLSERATVTFRIDHLRWRRWRGVRSFSRRARSGRNSVPFTGRVRAKRRRGRARTRALRPGRYRLILRARDAAGNRSERVTRRFRVVR